MDPFNMTLEQLEIELKKYNNLNPKEAELFNKGKDFIDKAVDDNNYGRERAKIAIFMYLAYKIKKREANKGEI